MSALKPILLGCSGTSLTESERAFFSQVRPFGFILFKRNCETPEQVRTLTASLRTVVQRPEMPIFVDQEGGIVSRFKPPYWPVFPSMQAIGALYEKDQASGLRAMQLHAMLTAHMLLDVGVNGNCAPVLDLLVDGASEAIGSRPLSSDQKTVIACGRIAIQTYLERGVYPVIKHIPGHGRVKTDPHIELPYVDADLELLEAQDFGPFRALNDAPMAMNCHVVFSSIDAENPVSLSSKVQQEIIRERIGFRGLLISDDLSMGAINLPMEKRGVGTLAAGTDIALYGVGDLETSREICRLLPDLSPQAERRWNDAQTCCRKNVAWRHDAPSLHIEMESLLAGIFTSAACSLCLS